MQRQLMSTTSASLIILGLAAAVFAAGFSLREYERHQNIGAASGYFAQDGKIQIAAVLEKMAINPELSVSRSSLLAIQGSIVEAPLNPKALALLGLKAGDAFNKEQDPTGLMAVSDRVSRREPLSQLWLLEDASGSDQTYEAIRHYHAVLSVYPQLREKLLPILALAIDYSDVRRAMRPFFKENAVWVHEFYTVAAVSSKLDPLMEIVDLIPSQILQMPQFRDANAEIFRRLSEAGQTGRVEHLAQRLIPNFTTQTLRTLQISSETLDSRLGPLAWTLADNDKISAILDGPGSISAIVQPAANGAIMTRYLSLEPGQFRFYQKARVIEGANLDQLKWQATCVTDPENNPFWIGLMHLRRGEVEQTFGLIVPRRCNVVKFELRTIGPESQLPTKLVFSNIEAIP